MQREPGFRHGIKERHVHGQVVVQAQAAVLADGIKQSAAGFGGA